jgi:hypothetical protein
MSQSLSPAEVERAREALRLLNSVVNPEGRTAGSSSASSSASSAESQPKRSDKCKSCMFVQ